MSPTINYQPLTRMEDIQLDGREVDLSKSPLAILSSLSVKEKVICAAIIVIAIVSMFFLGGIGAIYVIFIPIYILGKRLNKQKTAVWRDFALANGWQVQPSAEAAAYVPPSLASTGHSTKSSDVISGFINQLPFKLFNYQYTIGEGRDSQTFVETVFLIEMKDANLPELFLRAHKGLQNNPRKGLNEKLNLEGDFNSYFKVFSVPGQEVDDLVILTPDVMQFLISNSDYCVEIWPLGLAAYSKTDVRRADRLPVLINFLLNLHSRILANMPTYKPTVEVPAASPVQPATQPRTLETQND